MTSLTSNWPFTWPHIQYYWPLHENLVCDLQNRNYLGGTPFQQAESGPFLLLILFSYAFCAICARSSGIMYAYCVYHTKRRRVLLSLFYANFFPESLFLSHSSSFHHEKNAPKSYWKGFPSSSYHSISARHIKTLP